MRKEPDLTDLGIKNGNGVVETIDYTQSVKQHCMITTCGVHLQRTQEVQGVSRTQDRDDQVIFDALDRSCLDSSIAVSHN